MFKIFCFRWHLLYILVILHNIVGNPVTIAQMTDVCGPTLVVVKADAMLRFAETVVGSSITYNNQQNVAVVMADVKKIVVAGTEVTVAEVVFAEMQ